ncbi:MAG: hypothetical protein RBT61_04370 [Candidatus Kapabacteria bacterium]|nr:hypothetical protein [Candidatus Kapabacteria bacterium]
MAAPCQKLPPVSSALSPPETVPYSTVATSPLPKTFTPPVCTNVLTTLLIAALQKPWSKLPPETPVITPCVKP